MRGRRRDRAPSRRSADPRRRREDQLPGAFLDVYAVREGRWQMVAWQATRVPE